MERLLETISRANNFLQTIDIHENGMHTNYLLNLRFKMENENKQSSISPFVTPDYNDNKNKQAKQIP